MPINMYQWLEGFTAPLTVQMPKVRHLNHAPIIEAIIGIELSDMLPSDVLTVFSQLPSDLARSYPSRADIVQGNFSIELLENRASSSHEPIGFFFKSSDNTQVFHAKRNGFAFSRLFPYESWQSFRDEARKLWGFYRQCVGTATLNTFTVRYINKLFLPLGEHVEKFLQVYPALPDAYPSMQSSLIRLQFAIPEHKGIATVQQIGLPNERPNFATMLFDNEFRIPCLGVEDSEIWGNIEKIRDLKNEFFFEALTEEFIKTLE
jgi:uncharacterized protein (TIGR04255 family)